MQITKLYTALGLALVVGVAACDRGDGMDATGDAISAEEQAMMQQDMDPEVMAHIMEIQQIQQRIEPIQQQALQDPALAAQLEALQAQIETAMREDGSEVFARIDRFETEMAAAEAAGNQEQIQILMMEAQGLQQEVQALQAAVFERPEIHEPVQEFEAAHRAAMIEIDPEVESLLDRVEVLMRELPN